MSSLSHHLCLMRECMIRDCVIIVVRIDNCILSRGVVQCTSNFHMFVLCKSISSMFGYCSDCLE